MMSQDNDSEEGEDMCELVDENAKRHNIQYKRNRKRTTFQDFVVEPIHSDKRKRTDRNVNYNVEGDPNDLTFEETDINMARIKKDKE